MMKYFLPAMKTVVWRRTPEFAHQPLLDHTVGNLTGGLLSWMGTRALARGDIHEFNHILCALRIGNSSHTKQACPLPTGLVDKGVAVTFTPRE